MPILQIILSNPVASQINFVRRLWLGMRKPSLYSDTLYRQEPGPQRGYIFLANTSDVAEAIQYVGVVTRNIYLLTMAQLCV